MRKKLSKRERRIREARYRHTEEWKRKRAEGGHRRLLKFHGISEERWHELSEQEQIHLRDFYQMYESMQKIKRFLFPPKPNKAQRLRYYLDNQDKMPDEAKQYLQRVRRQIIRLKHFYKLDAVTFSEMAVAGLQKEIDAKQITQGEAKVILDYSMSVYHKV